VVDVFALVFVAEVVVFCVAALLVVVTACFFGVATVVVLTDVEGVCEVVLLVKAMLELLEDVLVVVLTID